VVAFTALGTETPYFATFKLGYGEFSAFAPTAQNWGYFLVLIMELRQCPPLPGFIRTVQLHAQGQQQTDVRTNGISFPRRIPN
jgi:hypothetical protein